MEPIKVIYQRKSASPKLESRKKAARTHSPNSIKDQSSKLFRIQVCTPSFYRRNPIHFNQQAVSPDSYQQNFEKKLKRKRVSYKPSSSLYRKLNVRLTLHTLEFWSGTQKEMRMGTRSGFRRTIDLTSEQRKFKDLTPLEARGSSINAINI